MSRFADSIPVFLAIGAMGLIILWRLRKMSEALDRLESEVLETTDVVDSAITLIQGLAQQIRDAVDDPEKLNALADALDAKQTELAQAITDNTPSTDPTPTPGEEDNG